MQHKKLWAAAFLAIGTAMVPAASAIAGAGIFPSPIISAEISSTDVAETYPEGNAYAVCRLNIRDTPEGNVLRTMDQGEQVKVKGYEGDWAILDEGYCYGAYLADAWTKELSIESTSQECARYTGYIYGLFADLPELCADEVADYDIYLCKADEIPVGETVIGLTHTNELKKEMWVAVEGQEDVQHIFYHEAGHAVDQSHILEGKTAPSGTEDFIKAYDAEKEIIPGTHGLLQREEYFAEAFFRYMAEPEKMEQKCPATLRALDKMFYPDENPQ